MKIADQYILNSYLSLLEGPASDRIGRAVDKLNKERAKKGAGLELGLKSVLDAIKDTLKSATFKNNKVKKQLDKASSDLTSLIHKLGFKPIKRPFDIIT